VLSYRGVVDTNTGAGVGLYTGFLFVGRFSGFLGTGYEYPLLGLGLMVVGPYAGIFGDIGLYAGRGGLALL